MRKQPTAMEFTRTQESWAAHRADMVRRDITQYEDRLRQEGIPASSWDDDETLLDLYEDEIFWDRYTDEMVKQRNYLRNQYLGGGGKRHD